MAAQTRRLALGRNVAIGTLYNARKDAFLQDCMIGKNLPQEAVETEQRYQVDVKYSYGDSYRKRLDLLGISPELAGNILGGLVRCAGVSQYLEEERDSHSMHAALQHTLITCQETLNLSFAGLREFLSSPTLSNSEATHMVAGIEWGSKSVISACVYPNSVTARFTGENELQTNFSIFASAVEALQHADPGSTNELPAMETTTATEITAYSEMFEDQDGILLENLQEAYDFLQMIPVHTKVESEGKGWPITYGLLPVEMLGYFLRVQMPPMRHVTYPALDVLDSAIGLFDQYFSCKSMLESHQSSLVANAQYLPASAQSALGDRFRRLQMAEQRFKDDFSRTLSSAKSGYMDPGALRDVLLQYSTGDTCPATVGDFDIANGKMLDFIHTAVASGALYVGHNGITVESIVPHTPRSEAFVLYFSPKAIEDETTWKPNVDLMSEILQNRSNDCVVAIVDCEATSTLLDQARIAQHQDGNEVVPDLLAHRSFMRDKCFAACDEHTLESEDIKPPIQRRHVTIACPGTQCSVAKIREWLCPHCMAPVEYGYSDQYIYCMCGRSLYSNYAFKCSSGMHGSDYTPYDSQQLLRLLNGLVQTNYLNVLILGETGVGKSTFINALVNYLEFQTLDEAIAAEKLNYVIPCSFSTQIMDRTNPDRPIEEKHIRIGARDDERDGSKGDSATQRTTVYPVTFNTGESTLTVRLIDTPGIGDSRGVDADRQNMADILSTLSGYDAVHGILILLKSNNARLTITFRYCIKELLTHLHHNAAANMAFGFTNTRISNYTPGDTYGPLKNLLDHNRDVGLRLETPTTYCFDSESFRYLAAYKSGVPMPNKLDFDRSWDQSRQETIRLIEHFQSIPPHEVKSTISLNGARQLISQLTKPLADISQTINTNIRLVEDQTNALKDTRLKGDELRDMLQVEKIQMVADPLSMPRTVCSHGSCVEVRDDGKGQNEKVILYNQHCHPECFLDDVQADVLAHPGLIHCAAFNGSNNCKGCGHHWQQHLHVLYELHEEMVMVTDDGVQRQLASHADDITLRLTAIDDREKRVAEYRQEQEVIRDAAAKFCVFLKNNSIVPYNDALLAYLDFLIKEEQAKVQAGGSQKRLLSLTEERHKHQEAIEIITRNMNTNAVGDLSEGGVDRMVQSLYNLKHFGENLKNMQHGITAAHQATYRERPYTVRRRNQPRTHVRGVERHQTVQHGHSQQSNWTVPPQSNARYSTVLRKPLAQAGPSAGGWGVLKRGLGFI